MHDSSSPEGPRPGSSVRPAPPVLAPRTDSERRRLAELAPNTDDSPTVISGPRQSPGAYGPGSPAGDDLRGRRLGHFELCEPIGVGGMAAVLRARDLSLGRSVALKILPPEAARNPDQVARFQSEARAAAKLDHENVARVFYCGEDQGLYFIAFEFVEGINLRDLLERRGPLPPAEAVHYMLQVATGLAHAAARGVVHRDVKPSNIIITPAGRAKLVDMGLARHLDGPADGVTQSGVTLGTFDYISPEQALEPRSADARSDIYSLGCTFYHALTGQPPVPEGTAAKKLHHHQHVAPPDPRQLSPAIPDDVAAVLGRMMAKDPHQRYQRPEDLVHDLLALARRLEPAANLPGAEEGGVLWVDARLPAPAPRLPGLLAAAAVLAVAALVAVIEITRPAPPPRSAASPFARMIVPEERGSGGADEPGSAAVPAAPSGERGRPGRNEAGGTPALPEGASRAGEPVVVERVEDLRQRLRDGGPEVRVRLKGPGPFVLDRREGDPGPAGLEFRGRRLELEADDLLGPPVVIRFVADPMAAGRPAAALSVAAIDGSGVTVALRNLRFECEALGGETPVAAVAADGLAALTAQRCAFRLPEQAAAGAVTAAGRPEGAERMTLRLSECLFLRGGRAVQLLGPARLTLEQCAFGSHAAVVHLRDTGGAAQTAVRLEHCSVMLEQGAVVHAEDGAGAQVVAGHCLFSRPEEGAAGEPPGDVVLLRQTGEGRGELVYQGAAATGPERAAPRNGYHNLGAFWSDETPAAGPLRAETLDDVRQVFGAAQFQDAGALELPQSPWQEPRPLARLAESARDGAPPDAARAAFTANLRSPRLHLARPSQPGVLGVERNVWGPTYPPSPSAEGPPEPPVVRHKVVDPAATTDARLGVYRTLAAALQDAQPGDTVLLKKTGLLELEPVALTRPDLRLTVRPFPRYRPVLALAATPDADAALFRLGDGELRLEGLEFALRPGAAGVKAQAVVAAAGNGVCTFHRCALTLDEGEDSTVAAVVLPDAEGVMRMGGERRTAPRVRFEQCFARGKGDLLHARSGRRFDLELDGTLAALDGSVVVAEGGTKEPPSGPASQLRLRRVTAVLTEYLLNVHAAHESGHGPGLPPVQVTCDDSLLAAAAGRALVHLENVDADDQVRQLVTWGEGRNTLYANTGPTLLDVQPSSPERMPLPMPYDPERWLAFTHEREMEAPIVRVRFANPPSADRPLTRCQPADFRPRLLDASRMPESAADAGAPLERLPRPADLDRAGTGMMEKE